MWLEMTCLRASYCACSSSVSAAEVIGLWTPRGRRNGISFAHVDVTVSAPAIDNFSATDNVNSTVVRQLAPNLVNLEKVGCAGLSGNGYVCDVAH